ncbi:glycosyltransferase sugar-binding protein containing DXD motif [Nitzschia inconspicua]|uniref:Glycosyltransferase sugar-binding protein containing DXD motif n=1 Tax=Nitzschia inconspicua TaxID=303405 RepID=A0A9K3Q4C2_9STRA|nr:glycosyltransferase sugar-binding protein containing DXD motif [Nitzschia inconspicua]
MDRHSATTTRPTHKQQRKQQRGIPQVLYQTAKHRCISTSMYDSTIRPWLDSSDLSYRFYDDSRMENYLNDNSWIHELFPALSLALKCIDHVQMPVMKADIWRYLILWERGGIFADLDVLPVMRPHQHKQQQQQKLQQQDHGDTDDSTSIFYSAATPPLIQELQRGDKPKRNDNHDYTNTNNDSKTETNPEDDHVDDALFVLVDTAGQQVLSQWFLAVQPRHPIMYYAVEEAAFRVLQAKRAIPIQHTGPRALYDATDRFLGTDATTDATTTTKSSRHLQVNRVYYQQQQQPTQNNNNNNSSSSSIGPKRRSFRVLPSSWATNNAFHEVKKTAYRRMNMTHYSDQQNKQQSSKTGRRPYNDGMSCLEFLGGTLPPTVKNGTSTTGSLDASYIYRGRRYSFRNPIPPPPPRTADQ